MKLAPKQPQPKTIVLRTHAAKKDGAHPVKLPKPNLGQTIRKGL